MAKNKIKYQLVVIGGSAGSVDVLLKIIPKLPKKISFAVVVVVHRMPSDEDLLLNLLQTKSKIKVKEAESNETIKPSVVYIAPADYHLLIENDKTFTLDFSEKVMHSRPSIDVTMQLAAQVYKNKLIGVLLTGANTDGASGMKAIQDNGGYTMIQDPKFSEVDTMPEAAENLINVNEILAVDKLIASLLAMNK